MKGERKECHVQAAVGYGDFALLASGCSYELVDKAALSGCPILAAISAAVLVLKLAHAVLGLRVLAGPDASLLPLA